jgi:hypothetical protein
MLFARQLSDVWRHATRHFRHLPTIVVLGGHGNEAKRLAGYLANHPRCFSAARLETSFFSDHTARSVGWYRAAFPLSARVRRKQGHVIEASASYLAMPHALRQMRQVLTKLRIVVLVGDPVVRAHEHYLRARNAGVERRGFEACVAEEIRSTGYSARFGAALEPNVAPMLGYVSQGYYALQLELLQKLYPRNKILVMDRTSLLRNANAACDRVFNFMGLESVKIESRAIEEADRGGKVIDPRAERLLREHYQPFDELLREISEQQFSWMQLPFADAA